MATGITAELAERQSLRHFALLRLAFSMHWVGLEKRAPHAEPRAHPERRSRPISPLHPRRRRSPRAHVVDRRRLGDPIRCCNARAHTAHGHGTPTLGDAAWDRSQQSARSGSEAETASSIANRRVATGGNGLDRCGPGRTDRLAERPRHVCAAVAGAGRPIGPGPSALGAVVSFDHRGASSAVACRARSGRRSADALAQSRTARRESAAQEQHLSPAASQARRYRQSLLMRRSEAATGRDFCSTGPGRNRLA